MVDINKKQMEELKEEYNKAKTKADDILSSIISLQKIYNHDWIYQGPAIGMNTILAVYAERMKVDNG